MRLTFLLTVVSSMNLLLPQVPEGPPSAQVRDILGAALIHVRNTLPNGPTALDPGSPDAPLMLHADENLIDHGRAWDGPRSAINDELARMLGASLRRADETLICGDQQTPCPGNGAVVHLRASNPRLDGDAASVLVLARWFSPRSRRSADPRSYTTSANILLRLERRDETWQVVRARLTRIS